MAEPGGKFRKFDRSIVEGPIGPAVWTLAWPTMLQNIIAGLQGIIDHAMVGHFVGYTANAAIGVSWQIILVVIVFISSTFTGMAVLVARFAGANQPDKVNRVVYQAFLTAFGLSLILAAVGYAAAPALLDLINAAPEVQAEALPFLREHPEVELSPEVMNRMGYHLAERNAAASLSDLLDGVDFKSRAGVLKATFSQWMLADLKGAGEWLRTKDSKLGNAAEADELRLMMVNAMKGGGAKESARAWAERISDPEKREKAVGDLE